LEFPEVFQKGGFDCILGNPPFLGGQKLSGNYGNTYLEYIKHQFEPIGAVDLVTYFFRRIFSIINSFGFLSLISTNTIAQGKAREDGLDIIVQQGGTINHAIKSMRWPGVAAVEVALVTITKMTWTGKYVLAGKFVKTITPYLDDAETLGNPYQLKQNENKSFQGSIVLGLGFVLEPQDAAALIVKNPKNKEVLFPYLNGDDLNNSIDQSATRWVINFFDWSEEKARQYPDCYEIVERLVKPERQLLDETKNSTNKNRKYFWWLYGSDAKNLYRTIAPLERVLVVARISKTVAFEITKSNKVFADALVVFPLVSYSYFTILQTTIHNIWAWSYCTTMKSDLNYTPGNTFETFPFPQSLTPTQEERLEIVGKQYHEYRRLLMMDIQLGLTKTYNQFHNPHLILKNEPGVSSLHDDLKSIEKNFGKETVYLIKHLNKTPNTISLSEAINKIETLRTLHVEMDNVVLEAYGWIDIDLKHDFYEVDYLPENNRIRFTIHPDARKEILKRLLELNFKIHEEEVSAGLWDNKKSKKEVDEEKQEDTEKGIGGLFGDE